MQLATVISHAEKRDRFNLLAWCKPSPVPTYCNKYLPDIEFIVHGFGSGRLYGNYAVKSSYFVHPCGGKETSHPNEKPIPLMRKLVKLGTQRGDCILDPFAGSGTTLRAAKDLGRQAIGIEIEEKYCRIAANRLRQEVLSFGD
jgi:site-specific DNA-methyltransferase (adenine-specific)